MEGTGGGEVRIVVKELKKHSIACVLCRKRKIRCSGTFPCAHCTSKGLECVVVPNNKKRGPPAKKTISNELQPRRRDRPSVPFFINGSSLNLHEPVMGATAELTTLLDAYYDLVDGGLPIIKDYKSLYNPRTPATQMQQHAVLAYMHCSGGHTDKMKQSLAEARVIAGSIFDDFSLNSASAFLLLSLGLQDLDVKLSSYYAGVARNIINLVEKTEDNQFVRDAIYTSSTILDALLPIAQRMEYMRTILPPLVTTLPTGMPSVVTLMVIFYVATTLEERTGVNIFCIPDMNQYVDRVSSYAIKEEEREHLLQYIDMAELIALEHRASLRNMFPAYIFLVHCFRTVVQALCGKIQQCLDSVTRMLGDLELVSSPVRLKVSICKDLGVMDALMALLFKSGFRGELLNTIHKLVIGTAYTAPSSPQFEDQLAELEENLFAPASPVFLSDDSPEFDFNHVI